MRFLVKVVITLNVMRIRKMLISCVKDHALYSIIQEVVSNTRREIHQLSIIILPNNEALVSTVDKHDIGIFNIDKPCAKSQHLRRLMVDLLSCLDSLPGGSQLDQNPLLADSSLLIELDETTSLGNRCLLVIRQPGEKERNT